MAKGDLLGPAACLVDHRVGESDGVEVVHDHLAWPSGVTRALA
jgi:hypothetical protein